MIAVDANILVRYAVKDDPRQTIAATDFLAHHSCFVLKIVLLELVWVLSSSSGYHLSRPLIVERVKHILGLPNVAVEDPARVKIAVEWYEQGMDFADALHLASSEAVKGFATFDKRIVSNAQKLHIVHPIILLSSQ